MTITVARLHKLLGELIDAGHGRKPVLVDKQSFTNPCENDGAILLPVSVVNGPKWIPMLDDDGGTKWNRDGTESGKIVVVLGGEAAEPDGVALPQNTEPKDQP
jgi:hypothetical protein